MQKITRPYSYQLPVILTAAVLCAAVFFMYGCRGSEEEAERQEAAAPVEETKQPTPQPQATPAPTPVTVSRKEKSTPPAQSLRPTPRHILPGRIEAEDYDPGGEGVGFHDIDNVNEGGKYRNDGVDVETKYGCTNVGWIEKDEWLAYTIEVPKEGVFDIDMRYAAPFDERRIEYIFSPEERVETTVRTTGAYSEFETHTLRNVRLTSGVKTLKIHFHNRGVNLDWVDFIPVETDWEPATDQGLPVAVQWKKTGLPAEGASVILRGILSSARRWSHESSVDDKGRAGIFYPKNATTATLQVRHEYAKEDYNEVKVLNWEEPLNVELKRMTTLYGEVLYENGRPAADATVRVVDSRVSAQSREDGSFVLKHMEYRTARVIATSGSLCSFETEEEVERISLVEGEHNGPQYLVLKPGRLLGGNVTDASSGAALRDVKVKVKRDGRSQSQHYKTVTNAQGRFQLAGVYGNRLRVELEKEGYLGISQLINLGSGSSGEFEFRLEPASTVEILVKDDQDLPLQGAIVYCMRERRYGRVQGATDAAGKLFETQVNRKEPPQFMARKQGYSTARATAQFEDGVTTGRVELVLTATEQKPDNKPRRTVWFTGTVTAAESGEPLPGIPLFFEYIYRSQRKLEEQGTTDETGRYLIEVEPGRLNQRFLMAYAPGWAPSCKRNLKAGTQEAPAEVNFEMAPGNWLNVKVQDEEQNPIVGAEVKIGYQSYGFSRFSLQHFEGKTGGEGTVLFNDLPGPRVILDVSADGKSSLSNHQTQVNRQAQITLSSLGIISGQLLDEDTNLPIPEFRIRIQGNSISRDRQVEGVLFNNSDGKFILGDLPLNNRFQLTFNAESYPTRIEPSVPCYPQDAAQLQTFYLSRGKEIVVRLIDKWDPLESTCRHASLSIL